VIVRSVGCGVLYRTYNPTFARGWYQTRIEINKIGNSDGLILPRELVQRLDLKRGQFLSIVELAGGGFQAMPYDPDFEKTHRPEFHARFGLDARDPAFRQGGLGVIERLIGELEGWSGPSVDCSQSPIARLLD
jgi:hypothetical protein